MDNSRARALHRFNSRHTNDRNVESHVLVGPSYFDDDERASASDLARPRDYGVGPFHSFNGYNRAVLDRNGLAEIEPRDLSRHRQAVINIGALFFRRRATSQHAFARKKWLQECGRVNERDPFASKLFGHSAYEAVGVFRRQSRKHSHHSKVGQGVEPEYLMMLDLSRHNHVRHLLAFEEANEATKLPHAHPSDPIRLSLYVLGSLFLDGCDYHLHALPARAFEHEKWEPPVACYQSILHKSGMRSAAGCWYVLLLGYFVTPRSDVSMK